MKWSEKLEFIRLNMKQNKSRNFMTVLAIVISCAFLISLASVGFGLQETFENELKQGQKITEIQVTGKEAERFDDVHIQAKDISYFKSLPHVKGVSATTQLEQSPLISYKNYRGAVGAILVDLKEEKRTGFGLSKGTYPKNKNEVVVGNNFAVNLLNEKAKGLPAAETDSEYQERLKKYGLHENLLGKKVKMTISQYEGKERKEKEYTFTVVGIGKAPAKEWEVDNNIYISNEWYKDIEQFTGTANGMTVPSAKDKLADEMKPTDEMSYTKVSVYGDNLENLPAVSKKLKDDNYYIYSVADELKNIKTVFLLLKAGLIFVGIIAVAIASIGIFNTMTMAVTERTREIGILKALGCRPSTVRQLFLIETLYLAFIGLVWGIVFSYVISFLLNKLVPFVLKEFFDIKELPTHFVFSSIPLSLVLISGGLSLAVALISGLRPAKKATQIDVITALK